MQAVQSINDYLSADQIRGMENLRKLLESEI